MRTLGGYLDGATVSVSSQTVELDTPRLRLIPITRTMAQRLLNQEQLGFVWTAGFTPLAPPALAFMDSVVSSPGCIFLLTRTLMKSSATRGSKLTVASRRWSGCTTASPNKDGVTVTPPKALERRCAGS